MDVKTLLARMAAQREHWADLGDGKRLRFYRPQEVDMPGLMAGMRLEHVVKYACGWEGFTEADLLGAAVGASDPLPFAPELWEAAVRDHADWVGTVAQAMAAAVTDYLSSKVVVAKNSPPSST